MKHLIDLLYLIIGNPNKYTIKYVSNFSKEPHLIKEFNTLKESLKYCTDYIKEDEVIGDDFTIVQADELQYKLEIEKNDIGIIYETQIYKSIWNIKEFIGK